MIKPDISSTWNEVSFRIYIDEHIPTYTISLLVDEFSNVAFPRLDVRFGWHAYFVFGMFLVRILDSLQSTVREVLRVSPQFLQENFWTVSSPVALFLALSFPYSSP
jgi:hypothetical protein